MDFDQTVQWRVRKGFGEGVGHRTTRPGPIGVQLPVEEKELHETAVG
jgi:hypothetical protein